MKTLAGGSAPGYPLLGEPARRNGPLCRASRRAQNNSLPCFGNGCAAIAPEKPSALSAVLLTFVLFSFTISYISPNRNEKAGEFRKGKICKIKKPCRKDILPVYFRIRLCYDVFGGDWGSPDQNRKSIVERGFSTAFPWETLRQPSGTGCGVPPPVRRQKRQSLLGIFRFCCPDMEGTRVRLLPGTSE